MQEDRIAEAIFYCAPDPDMDAPTFYGLFFANGQPKRVGLAFSLWAKMATHPQRLAVSSTPKIALWLLVGQNQAGELALLLANPIDKPVKYTILNVNTDRMTFLRLNDSEEKVQAQAVYGNGIEIGGYEV
jgi:hypothetical protein